MQSGPLTCVGQRPLVASSASCAMEALPAFPCAKLKLDQFFLQWLSENQDVVSSPPDNVTLSKAGAAAYWLWQCLERGPEPQDHQCVRVCCR